MPYPLFCLFCSYYFCSFSFLLSWGCNFLVVSSTLKMEHRPPISIPLQQLCSQCFRYVLPIFMLSHDINIYYGHQEGSYRILFFDIVIRIKFLMQILIIDVGWRWGSNIHGRHFELLHSTVFENPANQKLIEKNIMISNWDWWVLGRRVKCLMLMLYC